MGYNPQYTPFIGIGEIPHLPTSDPNFQRDIQVPGLRYTKKRQTKRRAGFFSATEKGNSMAMSKVTHWSLELGNL